MRWSDSGSRLGVSTCQTLRPIESSLDGIGGSPRECWVVSSDNHNVQDGREEQLKCQLGWRVFWCLDDLFFWPLRLSCLVSCCLLSHSILYFPFHDNPDSEVCLTSAFLLGRPPLRAGEASLKVGVCGIFIPSTAWHVGRVQTRLWCMLHKGSQWRAEMGGNQLYHFSPSRVHGSSACSEKEMPRCQSCVQLVYGELNWNGLIECPFWVFFCHYVLTSSSPPDPQQTHAHTSHRFRWCSCCMLWLYITLSSPSFPHRYEICNLNVLFCNQLSKWLIQLCTTSFHSFLHSYILWWFLNYFYFKERNKLFPIWIGEPGSEQKVS